MWTPHHHFNICLMYAGAFAWGFYYDHGLFCLHFVVYSVFAAFGTLWFSTYSLSALFYSPSVLSSPL